MIWNGTKPTDMTPDQLDAAEVWTIEQMQKAQDHYDLMKVGYEELAEERTRRFRQLN